MSYMLPLGVMESFPERTHLSKSNQITHPMFMQLIVL